MSRPVPRIQKRIYIELVMCITAVLLMIFSSVNLTNYFLHQKILGVSTAQGNPENHENFWNNFLEKNPNYVPGWIEVGNIDKAAQIDPNFTLP